MCLAAFDYNSQILKKKFVQVINVLKKIKRNFEQIRDKLIE